MKIKVYVHTSPEAMFARGKAAGLTDEAADYFRYYGEVPLTLEVDETSGEVLSATTEEAAERIAALETALRIILKYKYRGEIWLTTEIYTVYLSHETERLGKNKWSDLPNRMGAFPQGSHPLGI